MPLREDWAPSVHSTLKGRNTWTLPRWKEIWCCGARCPVNKVGHWGASLLPGSLAHYPGYWPHAFLVYGQVNGTQRLVVPFFSGLLFSGPAQSEHPPFLPMTSSSRLGVEGGTVIAKPTPLSTCSLNKHSHISIAWVLKGQHQFSTPIVVESTGEHILELTDSGSKDSSYSVRIRESSIGCSPHTELVKCSNQQYSDKCIPLFSRAHYRD